MKDLHLNKDQFKKFNNDDQFGFFYDEDGFSKQDANLMLESDVNKPYEKYESIVIDKNDNIYGELDGSKE